MEAGRTQLVASWLAVMGLAAVGLTALDRVPAVLTGTPPGVRIFASVEDAERDLGARIWLPRYYPETLRWPPARIEADAASPVTAAVRIPGKDDPRDRLVICESLGGRPVAPPEALLPTGRILETVGVLVGSRRATLVRLQAEDGRVLHDLSWDHGARRLTLRTAGPVEELLLIAASLEHAQS